MKRHRKLNLIKVCLVYNLINKKLNYSVIEYNTEKVTHIKGRILYQAMILYNYLPFQNGNFS